MNESTSRKCEIEGKCLVHAKPVTWPLQEEENRLHLAASRTTKLPIITNQFEFTSKLLANGNQSVINSCQVKWWHCNSFSLQQLFFQGFQHLQTPDGHLIHRMFVFNALVYWYKVLIRLLSVQQLPINSNNDLDDKARTFPIISLILRSMAAVKHNSWVWGEANQVPGLTRPTPPAMLVVTRIPAARKRSLGWGHVVFPGFPPAQSFDEYSTGSIRSGRPSW